VVANERAEKLGVLKEFGVPEKEPARSRALGRLESEARALQIADHPNVLRLLEFDPEQRFIVTEHHMRGALEPAENRELFKGRALAAMTALLDVADALRPLHQRGFVHRDIKTSNILVANDGRLILGDFGIVFDDPVDRRTAPHSESVGSDDWMPNWQ